MIFKRKKYGLLPHISKKIYNVSSANAQILGWEIIKFRVNELWSQCSGEGVLVGVIDTGCDLDHPDLKDNIVGGKNFIDSKKDPYDDNGHGSHVSGTIAASNNGLGMVGVAPKTKIMPLKALDDSGMGGEREIASAIEFAADAGCDIITMSLGSKNSSRKIENAIKYASKKGTVIFCAAGNYGPTAPIMFPANMNETIAIGAIDINLERTDFTCFGEELDFLSPGQDIISCAPDDSYTSMSGTSMATPFAVGCAALALSSYRKKNHKKNLTQNDYIELFKQNTTHLKDSRYAYKKEYEGHGILNPVLY